MEDAEGEVTEVSDQEEEYGRVDAEVEMRPAPPNYLLFITLPVFIGKNVRTLSGQFEKL